MTKLFRVARMSGVPVLVHWSVLALAGIVLLGSGRKLVSAFVAVIAYFSMLVVHEVGHRLIAVRRGYGVRVIEIYPIHALVRTDPPRTELDRALIAWGGAAAQIVVAMPFAAFILVVGYTRFDAVNATLAILGFMSPGIALLNLIPMRPLDGASAWRLFRLLWQRRSRSRRATSRRKPRRLRVVR